MKPTKTKSSAKAKPRAPQRKVTIELAEKRMMELHGYEKDELRKLFKTDEGIIKAYAAITKNLKATEHKQKMEADDSFVLPAEDLERLNTSDTALKSVQRRSEAHEIAASDPTGTLTPEDIAKVPTSLDELLEQGGEL
jgi:hypothetical protein